MTHINKPREYAERLDNFLVSKLCVHCVMSREDSDEVCVCGGEAGGHQSLY